MGIDGDFLNKPDARLIALAPTLARRVIAAEKLYDTLCMIADPNRVAKPKHILEAIREYEESK